jgi:hypothetical protein
VVACFRDHPDYQTALQLRAVLTQVAAQRQQTTVYGEAEQVCRVLGVPAARFLAALVEKNVSTAATLLGLDSDALAEALGLTLGRAHQLARALDAHEERLVVEGEEQQAHARYASHVKAATPDGTARRLLRALARQGGYAHVHDDARVAPADRVWLRDGAATVDKVAGARA